MGVLPTEVKYSQEDYKALIEQDQAKDNQINQLDATLKNAQVLFENIHNALSEAFDVVGVMPQDRPFSIVVESKEGFKPILRFE